MGQSHNSRVAQDIHTKFELYFVALSFTVAGFAIQTGHFVGYRLADALEATSWLLLFGAGCAGLYRIQYFPVLYRTYDAISQLETELGTLPQPHTGGEKEQDLEHYKTSHSKIEDTNRKAYWTQRRFFVIGLLVLVIARISAQYLSNY